MKLNILLSYDLAIMLFGTYAKELNFMLHTKTCTNMFIAALYIIAQTGKQLSCPSVGEWLEKLVHPNNERVFSAKKEMSYLAMKRHGGNLNAYN